MNLPTFILNILLTEFSADQVATIDDNWHRYSQLSFTNSSKQEFIAQGERILMFVSESC
jgi:CO dehydrogenase/acetyl-CoA synthase epsilon subunit